ncbi:MAG: hypothetical protein HY319_21240 [Armatimonadetes bacterium]|nr:hypothetical protein [Armatimonadota bacterium]
MVAKSPVNRYDGIIRRRGHFTMADINGPGIVRNPFHRPKTGRRGGGGARPPGRPPGPGIEAPIEAPIVRPPGIEAPIEAPIHEVAIEAPFIEAPRIEAPSVDGYL